MSFSYIKILLYCNKHSPVSFSTIRDEFKITSNEVRALASELKELGYIYYVGENSISTTYKARTIIKSLIYEWLFKNLLAIIDLIIASIGLVIAILALLE